MCSSDLFPSHDTLLYVFRNRPNCVFVEFNLLFEPLCVNKLKGSILADLLAMSNTVSPDVNSILSRISSRFSSGIAFSDVLCVEYIALIYQVLPPGILFGVILISFAPLAHSPISLGVIVIVLAFNPCATDSSIVSSVNVSGFSIIGVTFVTAPWLFNI